MKYEDFESVHALAICRFELKDCQSSIAYDDAELMVGLKD
jgi:hypothetical protein